MGEIGLENEICLGLEKMIDTGLEKVIDTGQEKETDPDLETEIDTGLERGKEIGITETDMMKGDTNVTGDITVHTDIVIVALEAMTGHQAEGPLVKNHQEVCAQGNVPPDMIGNQ